ncbi:MAG: hypothetical protein EOP84_04225 [Verrucomicrobiaceae bacterium]|nr:MAG: hypothetical protein EOP84_04225 [Verrucomicrobiaceae bacterium]
MSEGDPAAAVFTRLPDLRMRGRIFRRPDGGEIELVQLLHPSVGEGDPRGAEGLGLTHISIPVVDVLDSGRSLIEAGVMMGQEGPSVRGNQTIWQGVTDDHVHLSITA